MIGLIRALVDRPVTSGARRSRVSPVLVVEGAAGAGKTALLRRVGSMLEQRVPYALIDFKLAGGETTPQILSSVAFHFTRHCPGYGSVTFPRLAIARVVMNEDLDLTDRAKACRQVASLLRQERGIDAVEQLLQDTAGAALHAMVVGTGLPPVMLEPADVGTKGALGLVVRRIFRSGRTQQILLGRYCTWFGHRDRGLTNDALDMLVELNIWAQDPDAGDHRQVIDELLWDAFLTDLREHFADTDVPGGLAMNCVLLIDNADSDSGQEFIDGLVRSRGTRQENPDPLTVVAASRGDLLADRDPAEIVDSAVSVDIPARWRRHRLIDLTLDNTQELVVRAGLRSGNTPRLPLLIHQFTAGHPAATRLMVGAATTHESARDDPLALLGRLDPGTGAQRLPVAERMRLALLTDFPVEAFDDLVTCSSATDQQHARSLLDLLEGGEHALRLSGRVLAPPVAGAGPRVLGRLLLMVLAERAADHPASWREVFVRLRRARSNVGDLAGQLRYALAAEDLAYVVAQLEVQFTLLPAQQFLDFLLTITNAPRRPLTQAPGSPNEQMLAFLRRSPRLQPTELARLVVATWILNDALTDGRRRGLHLQLAADYEALASTSTHDDVQPLRQAGRRHQRQAELWSWN